MAINIYSEELVLLNEGVKLVTRPSDGTLRAAIEEGQFPAGKRNKKKVKLEFVKIKGRRYTSVEAWERFIVALNPGNEPDVTRREKSNG